MGSESDFSQKNCLKIFRPPFGICKLDLPFCPEADIFNGTLPFLYVWMHEDLTNYTIKDGHVNLPLAQASHQTLENHGYQEHPRKSSRYETIILIFI